MAKYVLVCPTCGGSTLAMDGIAELMQELLSQLMAGKELTEEQLNVISGAQDIQASNLCSCPVEADETQYLWSHILNWSKLNQLKIILIPD